MMDERRKGGKPVFTSFDFIFRQLLYIKFFSLFLVHQKKKNK